MRSQPLRLRAETAKLAERLPNENDSSESADIIEPSGPCCWANSCSTQNCSDRSIDTVFGTTVDDYARASSSGACSGSPKVLRRRPSPPCLHDSGRVRRTGGDCRGRREARKQLELEPLGPEVA